MAEKPKDYSTLNFEQLTQEFEQTSCAKEAKAAASWMFARDSQQATDMLPPNTNLDTNHDGKVTTHEAAGVLVNQLKKPAPRGR